MSRNLKALLTLRDCMVTSRTKLINSVRGYLRTQLIKVQLGTTRAFPNKARAALASSPDGMPQAVERLLLTIESLNTQMLAATNELQQLAKEVSAPRFARRVGVLGAYANQIRWCSGPLKLPSVEGKTSRSSRWPGNWLAFSSRCGGMAPRTTRRNSPCRRSMLCQRLPAKQRPADVQRW
jgi:hypothetical protein